MSSLPFDLRIPIPEPWERTLDRWFAVTAAGSTVRQDILAGMTTFAVMLYILFVNPQILNLPDGTGLPISGTSTSTALVAGVMSILMGVFARRAFALAPGMGINAIVAFSLVLGLGLSFPEAMGVIVAEGIVITLLVLLGLRQYVMDIVPVELKIAITVGIGVFIALIGLVNAGVVVASTGTPLTMGALKGAPMLVFVVGLLVTFGLLARRNPAAILIGIVVSTVFAIVIEESFATGQFIPGQAQIPSSVAAWPDFSLVGDFSFNFISTLGIWVAIMTVFTIMMADFFDTMGTLVGIGRQAGYLDENGNLPDAQKPLLVDSLAAVMGGASSASSATTYIESGAGVANGGRSGLVAATTGVLFLLAMFFTPLVEVVPTVSTAPALLAVGWLMMGALFDARKKVLASQEYEENAIDWNLPEIGLPVMASVLLMAFTYNITNGIGAGFLVWIAIRVVSGRYKEIHPVLYFVGLAFLAYFLRPYLGVDF